MPQFESCPPDATFTAAPELALAEVDATTQDSIMEAALRMEVAARCQRAYVHDLNNSLQPVLSGMEVLIRAATVGTNAPAAQVVEFARLAMSQHRVAMKELIATLIGPDTPPVRLDVTELLRKLVGFLSHEASHREVQVSLQLREPVHVHASASKLRLMLLAVLIGAIDAQQEGGDVVVSIANTEVSARVVVSDSRECADESLLAQQADSLRATLLLPVLRRMAAQEGHDVECGLQAGRYALSITLPQNGSASA